MVSSSGVSGLVVGISVSIWLFDRERGQFSTGYAIVPGTRNVMERAGKVNQRALLVMNVASSLSRSASEPKRASAEIACPVISEALLCACSRPSSET